MNLPATDSEGFLRDRDTWSPEVACALAVSAGITLGDEHMEILNFVRDYHATHRLSPSMRALVNAVRRELGPGKGRSIHLMRLFPDKTAKTIARLAGLPKPPNCD